MRIYKYNKFWNFPLAKFVILNHPQTFPVVMRVWSARLRCFNVYWIQTHKRSSAKYIQNLLNFVDLCRAIWNPITGSRSTFEFPSRVNLSGPSLYCIARTLNRTGRCNKVDAVPDFRFNLLLLKNQSCVYTIYYTRCTITTLIITKYF